MEMNMKTYVRPTFKLRSWAASISSSAVKVSAAASARLSSSPAVLLPLLLVLRDMVGDDCDARRVSMISLGSKVG